MKKRILTGILALMMIGSMSGCINAKEINTEVAEFLLRAVGVNEMEMSSEAIDEMTTQEASETTASATEQTTSGTTAVQDTEEVAQALWKEAYIAKVQELNTFDSGIEGAYLVDIDYDGIPELIAYTYNEGDMYIYEDGQLMAKEYPAAHVGERFYQNGDFLIAVSYGLDCMSGTYVTIARRQNNIFGCDEFWFHWDDDMNPYVNIFRSAGSETSDYVSAREAMEALGVQVTYEYREDYEPFLEYYVTVEGQELPCYGDLDSILAAIQEW